VRTSSRRSVSDVLSSSEATAARQRILAPVSSTTQTCCTLYSLRSPANVPQPQPEAAIGGCFASHSWRGNQLPLHPPGTLNDVCVSPALLPWGGGWPVGCLLFFPLLFFHYCLARATAAVAASWSVAARDEWPIIMLAAVPGRAVPGRWCCWSCLSCCLGPKGTKMAPPVFHVVEGGAELMLMVRSVDKSRLNGERPSTAYMAWSI
jgi:hypothetical protein